MTINEYNYFFQKIGLGDTIIMGRIPYYIIAYERIFSFPRQDIFNLKKRISKKMIKIKTILVETKININNYSKIFDTSLLKEDNYLKFNIVFEKNDKLEFFLIESKFKLINIKNSLEEVYILNGKAISLKEFKEDKIKYSFFKKQMRELYKESKEQNLQEILFKDFLKL